MLDRSSTPASPAFSAYTPPKIARRASDALKSHERLISTPNLMAPSSASVMNPPVSGSPSTTHTPSPSTSIGSMTSSHPHPGLTAQGSIPFRHEDNTGVDLGPGPMRHPRPLTAADLHLQLEKEQEAVVNRLTRELAILRSQSQSAMSNESTLAASTGHSGAAPSGTADDASTQGCGKSDRPAGRDGELRGRGDGSGLLSRRSTSAQQRDRSLSSHSTKSGRTSATSNTTVASTSSAAGTTNGIAGSAVSGIAPPRDSTLTQSTTIPYHAASQHHPRPRERLSRHSSAASRRSETSSSSLYQINDYALAQSHSSSRRQSQQHNHGLGPSLSTIADHVSKSHANSTSGILGTSPSINEAQDKTMQDSSPGSQRSSNLFASSSPQLTRGDEAARALAELDMVKRENERLKQRIRELERRHDIVEQERLEDRAGNEGNHGGLHQRDYEPR